MKNDWNRYVTNGYKTDEGINMNETFHQHPIFQDIMMNILMKPPHCEACEFELHHDKYRFFYGNNNRPDFVIVKKEQPCKSNYCSFIVELQLGSNIDDEHKGQVVVYNSHVLESVPTRSFIVSALTNLESLILFKTMRTEGDKFHTVESLPISFWNDGIDCLHQMIIDPTWVNFNDSFAFNFQNQNDKYYITRLLGKGATANVFKFQKLNKQGHFEKSNYAIKVFKNEELYKRELQTYEDLLKRFDNNISNKFLQQVVVSEKYKSIVYQPVGKRLEEMKLTQSYITQIFDAVGELHNRGIIHRDLSPNHFYKVDDTIIIIDFGCALFTKTLDMNDNEKDSYQGSIQFASLDILNSLADPKNVYKIYTPNRRQDLESVVRSLMYLHHGLSMPLMQEDDIDIKAQCTIEYWSIIDKRLGGEFSEFWQKALTIVRDDKISYKNASDALRKHFLENFPYYNLNNNEIKIEFEKRTENTKRIDDF